MMLLPAAQTEAAFMGQRQRDWDQLDSVVRAAQARDLRDLPTEQISRLSPLYRDVCADLSRARAARYGCPLLEYLEGLAAAAHAILYGRHLASTWSRPRPGEAGDVPSRWAGDRSGSGLRAILEAFPRAVRKHWVAMVASALLFFVPLLAGLLATLGDPAFAARIVPEAQLRPLTEAYRQGFDAGRSAGMDAAMAGFYVHNNVGIALRCFATGIAFGLGSAFYLVENGLVTGAMVGYVVAHGAGNNILTFIVGHSSLELGAIVLAGGSGLVLGWSIVAPGDKTRLASLQQAARSVVVVVLGAAAMLLLAAGVEGFWSASSMPSTVKRVVGAVMFALVVAYIALAGRTGKDGRWT